MLAIGHNDGSIFILDAETDTVVMSMQTAVGVSVLLWTHDDQYIVSMSRAGLQVWDSMTGDLLYAPAVIEPRRIALHPFNDQIFYFDRGAGVGVVVDVSTLIEPTPIPTATSTPTPPTTTFPETVVLDTFNRADGDLGGDWSGTTGSYGIAGNQVAVTGDGDIYWNAQSFSADQEVFVTLAGINPNAEEIDLLLKRQGTGWQDGLLEVWYAPTRGSVQVWTYLNGPGWVQHGGDIPVTFAAGDQFGARALADGTVEVYQNGIMLDSVDITAWPHHAGGGYIGLWAINASGTLLIAIGGHAQALWTDARTGLAYLKARRRPAPLSAAAGVEAAVS